MSTTIPGVKSAHCMITPTCRANRGIDGAFDEAARQVREAYDRYVSKDKFDGVTWHLALVRDDGDET